MLCRLRAPGQMLIEILILSETLDEPVNTYLNSVIHIAASGRNQKSHRAHRENDKSKIKR